MHFVNLLAVLRQREYEIGQEDKVGCEAQPQYDRTHTIVTKYAVQNKLKLVKNTTPAQFTMALTK
jgi:hypothetical protein